MKVTETPAAFQVATEIRVVSLMVHTNFHPTLAAYRNT